MKKSVLMLFIIGLTIACNSEKRELKIDREKETERIVKTIDNWNDGWEAKDVNLAIKDYSENIDWTNAFGARVQSKEELRNLLEKIFAMDFVMAGEGNYINDDVKFLTNDIALLRSTNIRKGQKWSDGSMMNDRYINHLRVYQEVNNEWKIISHMISQAHEKK